MLFDNVTMTFDALNRVVTRQASGSTPLYFLYTADDERTVTYDSEPSHPVWLRFTLRDFDGKLIRKVNETSSQTLVADEDVIFRGDQPLGKEIFDLSPTSFHLSLDHLGSVRTTTNGDGTIVAKKKFYPFGEEATPFFEQAAIALKYTGHERDAYDPAATGDDRDYMHARFRSPLTGRFLSLDPVVSLKRAMKRPQAWNRYTYVVGNPLRYIDPTGEIFKLAGCGEGGNADQCSAQKALLTNTLGANANQIRVNVDGTVSLAKGVSGSKFAAAGDFQKGLLKLIGDKSTFSLVTGTGRGAEQGGGEFVADKGGGGTIFLEPGMFPRMTGDVMGTAQTALVHETAHAVGTLFPEFYSRMNAALGRNFKTMLTEGYAVNFENRYRRAIGADIRGSYGGEYNDVVLDFDVDLFP